METYWSGGSCCNHSPMGQYVPGKVLHLISSTDQLSIATGPAIMVAYLTPTRGLGCRSGGYLLYGLVATAGWLLLLTASCLSHHAMLHYQRAIQKQPFAHFRASHTPAATRLLPLDAMSEANPTPRRKSNNMEIAAEPEGGPLDPSVAVDCARRSTRLWLIALAATLTRWLGKFLVVLNTAWIIIASLMEYVGGFDNCWCRTNTPGLGTGGTVVLFKSAHDLAQAAQLPWSMASEARDLTSREWKVIADRCK